MFIDGFGVYRNMHRTSVAFYVTLAGLTRHERKRKMNQSMLGLEDVIAAMAPSLHELAFLNE